LFGDGSQEIDPGNNQVSECENTQSRDFGWLTSQNDNQFARDHDISMAAGSIVDAVMISAANECRLRCSISHHMRGFAVRPQTIEEVLQLFEHEAFVSMGYRQPARLFAGQIHEQLIAERAGRSAAVFDTRDANREVTTAHDACAVAKARQAFYNLDNTS
jgi:hypothetical protein